ncbi:hypothetical protein BT93_L0800 [Corymbia citriodora subsp. variegata]|uniref:F-box domain-containing protein n=1 Tax=Corymbia citriodora subsp. variegata TaxID=360336 RepID=A0A8T0CP33_CORYI|nr:hypothetical protein BT93_L0800 [Corymbia citriodora subsp. variegata]
MTSSLSLDLLRNVLSCLPTVSLLQLRPVCREWCNIINDLHFVAMHATRRHQDTDPRFTVSDELLVTSLPESCFYRQRASCHRLLCFDNPRATYLLNPLTRKSSYLSFGKDQEIISTRAEILDQGSRSWKDIASVPPCLLLLLGEPMFAAGLIHWSVAGKTAVSSGSCCSTSPRRSSRRLRAQSFKN